MGTKPFANCAKSLWLLKVCIQLLGYEVCTLESITSPSLPLLPVHVPYKKFFQLGALKIFSIQILRSF